MFVAKNELKWMPYEVIHSDTYISSWIVWHAHILRHWITCVYSFCIGLCLDGSISESSLHERRKKDVLTSSRQNLVHETIGYNKMGRVSNHRK